MRLARVDREQLDCIRIRAQGLADGLELAIDKGRLTPHELGQMIGLARNALSRLAAIAGENDLEEDELNPNGCESEDAG